MSLGAKIVTATFFVAALALILKRPSGLATAEKGTAEAYAIGVDALGRLG